MHRITISLTALLCAAPTIATAQMRRSGGDGSAPRGEMPKGTPRDARYPYAGVWDGMFSIKDGPRGNPEIPIVMLVAVTDSAKGEYVGATILPNGARAPHLETQVVNGEMRWKQENSGGGVWVYTGKLVGRDSLAGTVALRDWPQLPAGETPPTGTFSLVRRPAGK